jgi:alpha-tubulin suppressor-like RCC1 family protein
VAYLARCARQRCREAPPIAAGDSHSLCLDAAGHLLSCGTGAAVGHGHEDVKYSSRVGLGAGGQLKKIEAVR